MNEMPDAPKVWVVLVNWKGDEFQPMGSLATGR